MTTGPHRRNARPRRVAGLGALLLIALSTPLSAQLLPELPRPSITADDSIELPIPTWDLSVAPYESHPRVAFYIKVFSGSAREAFERAMQRQSRYAPLIHERLRAGGLPEDLIFLPLIESWYDPNAYSRAAAVGMWQFMARTAKTVGMRVDWWVDERRDPVRATDGAVAFLNELKGSLGSVYLAAAAYNGGPGRVSRGLTRYATDLGDTEGEDVFFALAEKNYLRRETKDYVPKLIAAALVGKDPARYGMSVAPVAPFVWDSLIAPPETPLSAVAAALGVPLDTIRDYNPQLLRGMTPPGEPVQLRVPVGVLDGFEARFLELPEGERRAVERVITRRGESMTTLARRHGVTVKQLGWYNPKVAKLKSGLLRTGQTLLIPSRAVVLAARDVPNPAIERYGTSARSTAKRSTAGRATHTVRKGESLGVIAKRYGTTVKRLQSLNGMKGTAIRSGKKLRVR